jgi:predicted AAA+ superfamily ATPase
VRLLAGDRAAERRDLDREQDRAAALADPSGFVAFDETMVIDEIQRVPELLLAIKVGLRGAPDALPGRMETVELWPFSQGEIDGSPDGFIDTVFRLGPDLRHESVVTRADYANRIVRGGLPDAVARVDARRRSRFLDSYVQALIDRDVRELARIEQAPQLRTLIRLLAARSASLIVPGALESDLELSRPTIARYMQLIEEVYLIKRIPGWSRNLGTRATRAPKLVFVDSGIAAQQLAVDPHTLLRPGQPFGPLLEGFVISELARQATWSEQMVDLFHYRDQNKVEVDLILENRQRQVVAIEVKAATTVRSDDFAGLRRIAERLGDDLIAGIVLYTGAATLSFGDRMRAVPVSALWEMG